MTPNLSDNQVGNEGAGLLTVLLTTNSALTSLYLGSNDAGNNADVAGSDDNEMGERTCL